MTRVILLATIAACFMVLLLQRPEDAIASNTFDTLVQFGGPRIKTTVLTVSGTTSKKLSSAEVDALKPYIVTSLRAILRRWLPAKDSRSPVIAFIIAKDGAITNVQPQFPRASARAEQAGIKAIPAQLSPLPTGVSQPIQITVQMEKIPHILKCDINANPSNR